MKTNCLVCPGRQFLVVSMMIVAGWGSSSGLAQSGKTGVPDLNGMAALAPADAVAFLEIRRPGDLIDTVISHPAVLSALETKAGREALQSPQYLAFRVGLGLMEGAVGSDWQSLARHLTANGMMVSAGGDFRSFILVAQSDDEALLRKTMGTIFDFVGNQAKQSGQKSPFRIEETASGKLAVFDGFTVGRTGADLVVTESRAATERVLKSLAGRGADSGNSLAKNEKFLGASQATSGQHAVWMYLDLESARNRNAAEKLFSGMADNPAAELIVGGVLENLRDSDWALASLDLSHQALSMNLTTEHDPASVRPAREYFFGPDGRASADPLVDTSGMVASVTAWRDLSGWWLSKEELFDEGTVAGLVQADSQISTLFAGLDFGGEVLGALQPGIQLVADQQEYAEGFRPAIRLPSFALTGKLKDPKEMGRKFKNAFQSVMGFVNYGLSDQGLPQFDVNTSNTASGSVCSSQMVPDSDVPADLLVHNFSPTLMVVGDRLIISSTMALAEKIAGQDLAGLAESRRGSGDSGTATNTLIEIDLQQVSSALAENRESLVAQNMLENGHDRKTADAEIDGLLALAGLLKSFEARLGVGPKSMTADLNLEFFPGGQ